MISCKSSIVAYYPFNGNAKDKSGNGNHGDVQGPVLTVDRNGNENSAFLFDGIDDYIGLGNSAIFDLGQYDQFTISVWINPDFTDIKIGETILGKYDSYNDRRSFSLSHIPTNGVGFTTYKNGTLDEHNRVETLINVGWSHIVIVKEMERLLLYEDGILKEEIVQTFEISDHTDINLEIGATNRSNIAESLNFEGAIDDVRIYSRALSQPEIEVLSQN